MWTVGKSSQFFNYYFKYVQSELIFTKIFVNVIYRRI